MQPVETRDSARLAELMIHILVAELVSTDIIDRTGGEEREFRLGGRSTEDVAVFVADRTVAFRQLGRVEVQGDTVADIAAVAAASVSLLLGIGLRHDFGIWGSSQDMYDGLEGWRKHTQSRVQSFSFGKLTL